MIAATVPVAAICRANLATLNVPRTRCPTSESCARRAQEIDHATLAGLGLSTRKVGETLLALPGRPVSPTAVSWIARILDAAVQAFHRRPLANDCKVPMLDGMALGRKTGAGSLERPALVVPGLRPDGRKEIVDYRLAKAGSAAERERFLDNARGPTGEGLKTVDGGRGLPTALPAAYRGVPVQRCRARKIRNVLDKVRKAGSRQAGSARRRSRPRQGTDRRRTLRRAPGRCLPRSRRLPAQRSRRSADLLPAPRSTQTGQNYKCRAASARSSDEPDPWAPSGARLQWTGSCSSSSCTRTSGRE